MFSSLNCGDCSCTPIGRLVSAPRPQGIDMPPLPAMLREMVNMSERYMLVGSLISPNLNAVRGLAGIRMTSHFS